MQGVDSEVTDIRYVNFSYSVGWNRKPSWGLWLLGDLAIQQNTAEVVVELSAMAMSTTIVEEARITLTRLFTDEALPRSNSLFTSVLSSIIKNVGRTVEDVFSGSMYLQAHAAKQ